MGDMYSTTRQNWDPGEYTTDAPWEHVHSLMQAAKEKDVHALHGVGADMGMLAAFGRPHAFGSDGKPSTYTFSPTTRLFLPGSSSARRSIPQDATHGFRSWPIQQFAAHELVGTQDGLQSGALSHYLSDKYAETKETYDKSRGEDNDIPVVVGFMRNKYLMTGHHRAAAALFKGEPLETRYRHIS